MKLFFFLQKEKMSTIKRVNLATLKYAIWIKKTDNHQFRKHGMPTKITKDDLLSESPRYDWTEIIINPSATFYQNKFIIPKSNRYFPYEIHPSIIYYKKYQLLDDGETY